jgi:hypothetical protein
MTLAEEPERHCHHLQVGKAVGSKQRIHDTLPKDVGEKKRATGAVSSGGSCSSRVDWLAQPFD